MNISLVEDQLASGSEGHLGSSLPLRSRDLLKAALSCLQAEAPEEMDDGEEMASARLSVANGLVSSGHVVV